MGPVTGGSGVATSSERYARPPSWPGGRSFPLRYSLMSRSGESESFPLRYSLTSRPSGPSLNPGPSSLASRTGLYSLPGTLDRKVPVGPATSAALGTRLLSPSPSDGACGPAPASASTLGPVPDSAPVAFGVVRPRLRVRRSKNRDTSTLPTGSRGSAAAQTTKTLLSCYAPGSRRLGPRNDVDKEG